MNPAHYRTFYSLKIRLNIFLPSTPGSASCFPTKNVSALLVSPCFFFSAFHAQLIVLRLDHPEVRYIA